MCSPMPLEAPVTTASGGLLSASAFVILSMRSVLSVLPVAAGCALGSLIVSPFKAVGLRPYPEGPHLNGAGSPRADGRSGPVGYEPRDRRRGPVDHLSPGPHVSRKGVPCRRTP